MKFEVRGGGFSWNNSKEVFSNINFQIKEGEILAILGANGVGKTTLLRTSMSFLKWKKGGSFLNEKDIRLLSHKELWQNIAYVPQAKTPSFALSSIEMIVLGRNPHLKLLSSPQKKDYEMAENIMDLLDISYLKDTPVNRMSGGELQMVLIARALVSDPKLLVLDEPESNLDFANQLKILKCIKSLSLTKKISCIFNTHFPGHAYRIADYALLLGENGESRFGKVGNVLTEENIRHFFRVESRILEVENSPESIKTVIPLRLSKDESF